MIFKVFCIITGKREITANHVVKTFGLVTIITKACLKAPLLVIFSAFSELAVLLRAFEQYLAAKYHNNVAPKIVSPNFKNGKVINNAPAPNKAIIAQINKPTPHATAQYTPESLLDPIDVPTVFKTLGPGINTFNIKKPRAGNNSAYG